ncbi:Protein GRLD-1 a [Aphelenchoides avenae]|nr:Protein GRLD-1 a [Aphelenchus avenae]
MGYTSRESGRDRPAAYRTSNDRGRRSSPSSSRSRVEEHRSRKDAAASECLSAFYRERFGSHSPEDYLNLRLSQFDPTLSKDKIRSILEQEFRHFDPFEVKIVRNPDDDERLAYVNFERPDCAKKVRRTMIPRLQKILGRRIIIDPTGVIRDQEGKYIPDRYNRAAMALNERDRSPRRRRSPMSRGNGNNDRRRGGNAVFNLNQDDSQATRTLFVGNLPGDVRENELRRVFEVYGDVDDVDIKQLADSNAAYAFVMFKTVDQAIDARKTQHGKPIRPGSTRCQIGYGKSQVSPMLWVGGLGSWTTKDLLLKEFERYGNVENVDYEEGSTSAYIRFTDTAEATDACRAMKNYPLGGNDKCISVDFAKVDSRSDRGRKRRHSRSPEPNGKRRGPKTPSASPTGSPSREGYIETYDELKEQVASTWKGLLSLKKADYPLRFHRVFGREHLLQDLLRDDDGNALKLTINQRLPLDTNFYQKMIDFDKQELALMIAVEGDRPVETLVKYLTEKNAAGVVTVNGGVVYVLAHSATSDRLIKFFAPRVALMKPGTNYLLVALKKSPNITASTTHATAAAPTASAPPASAPSAAAIVPPPPIPPNLFKQEPLDVKQELKQEADD